MLLHRRLAWLVLAIGCSPGEAGGNDVNTYLAISDTIFTLDDSILAQPEEVSLDERGRLYLSDGDNSRLAILDTSGNLLHRVGQMGAGPGEFNYPTGLLARAGRIHVIDTRNGRLQVLDDTGGYISSRPLPPGGMSGLVSQTQDGRLLVGLTGGSSFLARRYGSDGSSISGLGRPSATVAESWDFVALKTEIREGRVPAALANLTMPVLSEDGSAWLVGLGNGVVERYSASDSLLWRLSVHDEVLDSIRARFFDLNNKDPNPRHLHTLRYFSESVSIGDELWTLLRWPDSPAVILVVDSSGDIHQRITLRGATGITSFAVDSSRGLLFLLSFDNGTLVRVRIPEALLPPA